jgi:hypothetical protein
MRATLMYGAGDVRVETVPNPTIQELTDATVRIVRLHLRQRPVALRLQAGDFHPRSLSTR